MYAYDHAVSMQPLRLGTVTLGSIKAGVSEHYSIDVTYPSFLLLSTDLVQGHLEVVLRDPGNRPIKKVVPIKEFVGAFRLTAVLDQVGSWSLEVLTPPTPKTSMAAFELRIVELRPTRPKDQDTVLFLDKLNDIYNANDVGTQGNCASRDASFCAMQAAMVKGLVHERQDKWDLAKGDFETALQGAISASDSYIEAASLAQLVLVLSKLGDFRIGTERAREALIAAQKTESLYLVATAHSRLCGMLEQTGHMSEAMKECEASVVLAGARLPTVAAEADIRRAEMLALQGDSGAESIALAAREVFRQQADPDGESYALTILADKRFRDGDFQGALQFAMDAQPLYENHSDPIGQASNLRTLGNIYARLGEVKMTDSHYARAAEISHAIKDKSGEAQSLNALGWSKSRQGDSQTSLSLYTQALGLAREISERHLEAEILTNQGREMAKLKDIESARKLYKEALAAYRDSHDVAKQGQVLGMLGGLARSTRDYDTALEYYRQGAELERKAGDRFGFSVAELAIANLQQSQDHLDEALQTLKEGVQQIEAERKQLASPNLRMSFYNQVRGFYESAVTLLMQMHGRSPNAGYDRQAFWFSESAHARVLLDNLPDLRDVIPASLAGRERELRSKIATVSEGKSAKPVDAELLKSQYEALYSDASLRSPWLKAEHRAPVLVASKVQELMLDEQTILVEYKVCDAKSFAWVIAKDEVHAIQLAGRAELARLAAALLKAQKIQTVDGEELYQKAAEDVSRAMIAPLANWLRAKRILFVTDDVLQQLPLAGLPWPAAASGGKPRPLISEFEIVNVPSASAAAAVRGIKKPEARFLKEIAVFADPLDPGHIRLREAEKGARLLASKLPPGQVSIFTGADASLSQLQSAGLENYRVIEFATHAEMDLQRPEASGIHLSSVDAQGHPQPGILRLRDIYQLHINPDLVLLSACESATGENMAGEGLLTLSRAFLFAGARRVIATLWLVKDTDAQKLTSAFYSHLFGQQRMNPAAALQQTQIGLWKAGFSSRRWAAFMLLGDWD